jgi:type IV pilus assembly protein PilQ
MISAAGPASVIQDVRAVQRGSAVVLTMYGTGPLSATTVVQPTEGPTRLEMDLPNTTSGLPGVVPLTLGPVTSVRIGLSPEKPLSSRVVLGLSRRVTFRIEHAAEGRELAVVFDAPTSSNTVGVAIRSKTARRKAQVAVLAAAQKDTAVAISAVSESPALSPPANPLPSPSSVVAAVKPSAVRPPQPPAAVRATSALALAKVAALTVGLGGDSTTYSGHAVSLDFQNADLRAVLRAFAEISGLNMVIDPTIQGSVDVALRDVPWDQAFDIILRANKLGYSVEGTIVRVTPLLVIAEEEAQRRRIAEEQALSGELEVVTRALSYAKAEDVAPLLTRTVLSARGQVQTDARTNTLIVNDLPEQLARAMDLITTLDQPQPQVEIEARIVQTTREFARTLGVQWGVGAQASQALGNTLPLAFPNQASITGRTGGRQGPPTPAPQTDAANTLVNLGVPGASSAIGVALGAVNGALNLDLALSALERQGQGRLLSTPRVSTQNNVEAEITQGVQVPIQTVANNTVTVTFKDAALTLKVTPQITAANTVIMRIAVENASPDFSRSINNIPPIDTQRAVTQVLVKDGETTVIGGIYVSSEQSSQDRTPGLHRLPLLGWLFKRDGVTDESRELLIFITPRIIRM